MPRIRALAMVIAVALAAVPGSAAPVRGAGADTAAQQRRLQAVLDRWRDDVGAVGATLRVVKPGEVDWTGTTGFEDPLSGRRMRPDTQGRVGSSTKSFTTVVLVQLAEEGVVDLDAPIARWFPDYPNAAHITIRDLLSNRSGIPDVVTEDLFFIAASFMQQGKWWTPQEIMDWTTSRLPMWSLGERRLVARTATPVGTWRYSQPPFLMAAVIAERETGTAFADLVRTRIVEPLGLTHTFLPRPGDEPTVLGWSNMLGLIPTLLPSTLLLARTQSLSSASWAATGMVSTAGDLSVFLEALFEGRLLSAAGFEEVTRWLDVPDTSRPVAYGLGLFRTENRPGLVAMGQGGAQFGFRTTMEYVPSLDLYVTAIRNTDDVPWGRPVDVVAEVVDALSAP